MVCGHQVVTSAAELSKAYFLKTYWWTLTQIEQAFRCTICQAKQCKMQIVDSVDGSVYEMTKMPEEL